MKKIYRDRRGADSAHKSREPRLLSKLDTVVVCTEHSFAFVELLVAWISGVKTRAAWSHFSDYQGASRLKRLAHFFARPLMRCFANMFLACTKGAGVWLFGNFFAKNLQKHGIHIINNAIDTARFAPCAKTREEIRAAHGLSESDIAVGIVGRLTAVKNHAFALEVFASFAGATENAAFFVIGDGELREEIEARVGELKIPRIIFTGAVGNVHEYYQALDVLIQPSFHEGLSVVSVEAQASGLPIIMSDSLTRDVQISNLAFYESLDAGAAAWAEKIRTTHATSHAKRIAPDLSDSGFCIKSEAKKLQKILLGNE